MNELVKNYIDKYPAEVIDTFNNLRQLIFDSVSGEVEELTWAKLPSYYVGTRFVRLIPFKDHINIESEKIISHKDELKDYKITPQGMLQIYLNQEIPTEILQRVFTETFE